MMTTRSPSGGDARHGTSLREVQLADLSALLALEEACFSGDRLGRRAMRAWIKRRERIFLVVEDDQGICADILVIRAGSWRLARIYSLAVHPRARGRSLARQLLAAAQQEALARGAEEMRLEVHVGNQAAIALYRSLGYTSFGSHDDYYHDHSAALRMQRRLRS